MKPLASAKHWLAVQIWNHTMTCQELTRLASQARDRPLSLSERVRLRLHTLICAWCHRYVRQLEFLRHAATRLEDAPGPAKGLSPGAKDRLRKALQDHRH